jgi:3-dehydroquinate synthase
MEQEAGPLVAREAGALQHLVRRSVEIKAEVVSEDEREGGRRAILNAGHTVAHALEQATEYRVPHGEAVGLGLVAEAALATGLGLATPEAGARVVVLLERLGLPTRVPEPVTAERLLAAMAGDKKNRRRGIRFALPRGLGAMGPGPDWTTEAGEPAIRAALLAIS